MIFRVVKHLRPKKQNYNIFCIDLVFADIFIGPGFTGHSFQHLINNHKDVILLSMVF